MAESRGARFSVSNEHTGYRREVARLEPGMKRRILSFLSTGPKSVPEVASGLGLPSNEVMWWMMGLARYGEIIPTGETNPDGYHTYGMPGEGER